MSKDRRLPSTIEAAITLIVVIAVIILSIRFKFGAQMSLFFGAVIAAVIAMYLGNKWRDIQDSMVHVISDSMIAIIIIMIVGTTVGVWIVGGTVPSLLYYGLKFITPSIILPLTFLLCALTSIFTGTSFGSIATMGLALVGVGTGLGVPAHIVAGAVISGSYFGDKMSPMSDTTNMAPAMSGSTLYNHIGAMLYTTVPATVITIILYAIIGAKYAGGTFDPSSVKLMSDTLAANFNISLWALIPAFLVLFISYKKVPAVLGLGICAIVSIAFAVVLQDASFKDVVITGYNGFKSTTGVAIVDTILTRGGIKMIQDTIILIVLACMMGGALNASGALNVLVDNVFLKVIKSPKSLVISTMAYCYAVLLMSGNQVLGIILGGRTFQQAYKDLDLDPRVLSRTLEDTNTLAAPLVPWGAASAYTCGVLGVTIAYIPYAFLAFIVPIFSIICVFTGWGIWHADGSRAWGKKKGISAAK